MAIASADIEQERRDAEEIISISAPLCFNDRVERVASCLVDAVMADYLELDTRNNSVHAYIDAHYL